MSADLYLGKLVDSTTGEDRGPFHFPVEDLMTHLFICGATGSGKTVLGKAIIEEAALLGIPSIVVDLKGDLSSLALKFPSAVPEDFAEWVESRNDADRAKQAAQTAREHLTNLARYDISPERVACFSDSTRVVIFTPTSKKGIPLALSSLPPAPADVQEIFDKEPETVVGMVDSITNSLVERLFPATKPEKVENERKLLYALVEHAWLNDIPLDGLQGLEQLIGLVQAPPIHYLGVLPLDKYISPRRREDLAVKINGLLIGVERLWHEGQPLDIDLLSSAVAADKRTQVSIINLTELDRLEDRSFVIAQLGYAIYNWMRRKGGTSEPRLLVYIDEIGGAGGRQAIYPPSPYNSSSKPALSLLIRQGRAFGVGCVLATQNPGDIDYRGLSNCATWAVGRLSTSRDRDKIKQGVDLAEIRFEHLDELLATLNPGQFLIKARSGDVFLMSERWLMTYHKTVPISQLARLTDLQFRQQMSREVGAEASTFGMVLPAAPRTPAEILASFHFGGRCAEPFVTVTEPLGALSGLIEKIGTVGIQVEEVSFRGAALEVARIAAAKWDIDKIRRDSQGQVRETIRKQGTVYRWAASSPIDEHAVEALHREGIKGASANSSEIAAKLAVVLPDRLTVTKEEVRHDVAPRFDVPLKDVRVDLQMLNVGHRYSFAMEYRNAEFIAHVDAISGMVHLMPPVFSAAAARAEVQNRYPDITGFRGEAVEDGRLYRLVAISEDYEYTLAVHKNFCKITECTSVIAERMARQIAHRLEPREEPIVVRLEQPVWILAYANGRVLRIDRQTQKVIESQHPTQDQAAQVATAAARQVEPEAQLSHVDIAGDRWQFTFQVANREVEVSVDAHYQMHAVVRPCMEWMREQLQAAYPDSEFSFSKTVQKRKAGPGPVYMSYDYASYRVGVKGPSMGGILLFSPAGDITWQSKKVRRDYAEEKAASLMRSYGIDQFRVVNARGQEDRWAFDIVASEVSFTETVNEADCQILGLTQSKQDAVARAHECLKEQLDIQRPDLQQAQHQKGAWRLTFSDPKGSFVIMVDNENCRVVKEELTEAGARYAAGRYVQGEAVAIRRSFWRGYWEVEVKSPKGTRKVKITQGGQILP